MEKHLDVVAEREAEGWLLYDRLISEIEMYRSNAVWRIREHEKQFNMSDVPELFHVAEYYKNVGVEIVCSCLESYCKDSVFLTDEVKRILTSKQ